MCAWAAMTHASERARSRVELIEQLPARLIQLAELEELAIAQPRQDPALDDLHTPLRPLPCPSACAGEPGSWSHHNAAPSQDTSLIRRVDVGLVAIRAAYRAAKLVGYGDLDADRAKDVLRQAMRAGASRDDVETEVRNLLKGCSEEHIRAQLGKVRAHWRSEVDS